MIEWDLTEFFLTRIVAYGPGMLALALFLGGLGVSLPGTIFVLGAGAFVRQGLFSIHTAFPLALIAVVAGDSLNYGVGYYFRDWISGKLEESERLEKLRAIFHDRCGPAVYFTRFVFTPLAIPVNLLSASTGYPFRRFLLFDLAGEVTWLVVYGSLGYVFASQWALLSQLINNVLGALLGAVLAAVGLWVIVTSKISFPGIKLQ